MTPRRRQGLPDWLVIARREFIERVRTPWFVVVTLLGPIMMVALIVVPAVLARAVDNTARVEIVDHSGRVGEPLKAALGLVGWKADVVPTDMPESELLHRIADDRIDGFLIIPAEMPGSGTVIYEGDNATNALAMQVLYAVTSTTMQALRGAEAKPPIPASTLATVLAPVRFDARHTTGAASSSGTGAFIVGYVVMFILYMSIILYAANVMRSVVQEKTNRVVEIMVAAAKPRALMFGKIIGVGGVGLVQIMMWAAMAILSMTYRGELLGLFGVAHAGDWSVPPITVFDGVVVLVYFLLGYFFYSAIYAAIGAMVSSEQEAQQAQTPVVLLLIIPVASVQLVANDPRGPVAEALTQIPFSAPVLMPMRWLLGGASTASLILSLVILSASTYVVARLAARIYRVGILMYGKRPSLRELVRWLRY